MKPRSASLTQMAQREEIGRRRPRFFFNFPCGGTPAAVDPVLWASRHLQRELVAGERLALGFDGSQSRDGTALVGCTADGWLFPVEIIERPANVDDWRVDRSKIHRALNYVFETYEALRRHVLNARLRKAGRDEDGRGRYTLEKAGPGRLIDGCIASVLAYEAATQIVEPEERVPFVMGA